MKVLRKNRLAMEGYKREMVANILVNLGIQYKEVKIGDYWEECVEKFQVDSLWKSKSFFLRELSRYAGPDYIVESSQKTGTYIRKRLSAPLRIA